MKKIKILAVPSRIVSCMSEKVSDWSDALKSVVVHFFHFFTPLSLLTNYPQNRKELLALLIQEVVYAQEQSKIKLTLRPLPDLHWQVEGDKVSFDERTNWLPR